MVGMGMQDGVLVSFRSISAFGRWTEYWNGVEVLFARLCRSAWSEGWATFPRLSEHAYLLLRTYQFFFEVVEESRSWLLLSIESLYWWWCALGGNWCYGIGLDADWRGRKILSAILFVPRDGCKIRNIKAKLHRQVLFVALWGEGIAFCALPPSIPWEMFPRQRRITQRNEGKWLLDAETETETTTGTETNKISSEGRVYAPWSLSLSHTASWGGFTAAKTDFPRGEGGIGRLRLFTLSCKRW